MLGKKVDREGKTITVGLEPTISRSGGERLIH